MTSSTLRATAIALCAIAVASFTVSAQGAAARPSTYEWTRRVAAAPYAGSYNYPVYMVRGEAWSLHPNHAWKSTDGITWRQTALPKSGLNSAYQKYLQLGDTIYALGSISGNYQQFTLRSHILRTTDLQRWDTLALRSNLPQRVFYGATTHGGKMWLLGGYDGKHYHNDVWSSTNGVQWTRVVEHAPWSARNVTSVIAYRNRLWIVGGGVIDGDRDPNPTAEREIWSSNDGVRWTRHRDREGPVIGGTPVVFDGRLWLIGANRRGTFDPGTFVTDNLETWTAGSAPWPARGGAAVWVMNDQLFMTGGKYSEGTGEGTGASIRFMYRNDVWSMRRKSATGS